MSEHLDYLRQHRCPMTLSSLLLTSDEALSSFIARRAADKQLDEAMLKKARGVAEAVCFAILSEKRADWDRIERAYEVLRGVQPPVIEPKEDPAKEAEPAPAAVMEERESPPTPALPDSLPKPPSMPMPAGRPPEPTTPSVLGSPLHTPDEAAAGTSDFNETATLDPAMFAHLGKELPFNEGVGPAPPPSAAAPGALDDVDLSGGTGMMDENALKAIAASFPLPTKLPMAVEQYAALVARTEQASPDIVDQVHAEYAIADATHRRRVDDEFSEAFSRDAALRTSFVSSLKQWRDYLKR